VWYVVLGLGQSTGIFTPGFAIHIQHRDLTECPATLFDLKCTALKSSTDGTGHRGTFVTVGSVSADNTPSLDSFDPAGCNNIFCETNATSDNKCLNWIGSHDKNGGHKGVSSKAPYELLAYADAIVITVNELL
jgi:hypothetical protein